MRTGNAADARLALVVRVQTRELPEGRTKHLRLPRFIMRRRSVPGQGPMALAALGRETGARC